MSKKCIQAYTNQSMHDDCSLQDLLDLLFSRMVFISRRAMSQKDKMIEIDLYKVNYAYITSIKILSVFNDKSIVDFLKILNKSHGFLNNKPKINKSEFLSQNYANCQDVLFAWCELKKNNFNQSTGKN